jgi:hypothetical protein
MKMPNNEIPDDLTGTDRDLWDPTFGTEEWQGEVIVLSEEEWDEFNRLLNEPAKVSPKLTELFAQPSPFEEAE